ncbi:MAG: HAMP domain-containing sensor histidine kinase [Sulfurovaceae bacterium]
MTTRNRLKSISLLPILIMMGLASYLLFTIYPQFDINNQEYLILAISASSIIVLGFILLIYGYITSNQELENTVKLIELFEYTVKNVSQTQTDKFLTLKLDTYEGKNHSYDIIKEFVDPTKENKYTAIETDGDNIIFAAFEEFENIIEIYTQNAIEKNIDLNFYIDPKISPKLKGNLEKIKEILNNLLNKALQFTNADDEINVEIHKISEESHDNIVISTLVFKVQDNSMGMTKEEQEQIFEPLNPLGLAKSNQFAHTMGGHIEVESATDTGTTFYLTLPIEEIAIENSNLEDALSNTTIGLYEDDNISSKLVDYLKNYLKFFGAKVKIFKSIKKASSLSEKDKCMFCLIDIDKADEEIIESLSTVDKSKLIVMSRLSNKDKLEQLGLNEQNIIFKPVTLSKIKEILFSNNETAETSDISQISPEDGTSTSDINIDINDSKIFINEILIFKTNDLESKIIAKAAQNMGYSVMILDDSALLSDALKNGKYDMVIIDEETIDKLDDDIHDNINIITTNVIEELKRRKL